MSTKIKLQLENAQIIADGKNFDDIGAYEYLKGWVYYTIVPKCPLPTKIVDLENAPKNRNCRVEYSS